ncbi:MAG TPA: PD-(D/E)XK nuclease family protein [Candidatus Nanoarchaeia archaeon]|nr:PD-(D/E)XK nuclease family protein [Candidatus Nanoarchaeia archaeon]
MYKLSPSSLNLLEDCPRCFYLQLVNKISRPSGPFPSLPSGVDKILKQHFDSFMEKDKLPLELIYHKKHDYKLFNNKELLSIWRNNFKGIQYEDKNSGILLRGAVDNILIKGKKLVVLDYKTRGFPVKEDTAHHYQDQLNIYNFLLRKNGYETEDYAYLLFYVPENVLKSGEFVFKTELVKMNINVKHAENLFKKAIKVLNGKMPKASKECKFCEWKEK